MSERREAGLGLEPSGSMLGLGLQFGALDSGFGVLVSGIAFSD